MLLRAPRIKIRRRRRRRALQRRSPQCSTARLHSRPRFCFDVEGRYLTATTFAELEAQHASFTKDILKGLTENCGFQGGRYPEKAIPRIITPGKDGKYTNLIAQARVAPERPSPSRWACSRGLIGQNIPTGDVVAQLGILRSRISRRLRMSQSFAKTRPSH